MKFSKIKKITKIILDEAVNVYDISTPQNRNFVANGAVVHNSEFSNIAHSSCNLGSLNLTKYVVNGEFDFIEFGKDVGIATRFLDSIIDINEFPTEKIHLTTHAIRPIGLGVMGLAHAMILMKMPYASKEAKEFTRLLIGYITLRSMTESIELAKEKGAYPAFDYDTFTKANDRFFFYSHILSETGKVLDIDVDQILFDLNEIGVRNSCFTSIAPTGTISFIADVSGGIEPVFALAYARKIEKEKDRDGNLVYDIAYIADRFFDDYLTKNHNENKKAILKYTSDNKGSCQGCSFLSNEEQELFKTAQDLKSTEHLDVLEAVARMTSLSVSKCVSKNTIINADGKLKFISSLSNNRTVDTFSNIDVKIINKDGLIEKSKAFYYNGVKPCKTITLNNGIRFTATNSHKILSKDCWIRMDDINVGLTILA